MPSILTANRLTSGTVVYLAATGGWTERIAAARTALHDADVKDIEAIAARAAAANEIVGAYVMPVRLVEGRPEPVSVRERIRAERGPSF